MRNLLNTRAAIFFHIVCIIGVSCKSDNAAKDVRSRVTDPKSIIFDTDISGDYDDVGAMAVLHALADKGEIKILGTLACNKSPLVAPTIDIINTYYGRPDIPIGVVKSEGVNQDSRELHWPDTLVKYYPHTIKSNHDAPDAVTVYRQILSSESDTSVTIVTVGFLTNMKNLLQSSPDSISELNGRDLVAKKVKTWVAMAGHFPSGKEANVRRDSAASQYAIDNWPTPIIFSGFEIGKEILTGLNLIKSGERNPISIPYEISMSLRPLDRNGRSSWDQTAVLAAARGGNPYFSFQRGAFLTSSDGSNSWEDDAKGPHIRLIRKMDVEALTEEIESLMRCVPEKLNYLK